MTPSCNGPFFLFIINITQHMINSKILQNWWLDSSGLAGEGKPAPPGSANANAKANLQWLLVKAHETAHICSNNKFLLRL